MTLDERTREDPAQPPTDPGRPPPPIVKAAYDFASVRDRSAAIYFLAHDEPIDASNVRELADRISERRFDELDLVIHSSGGDVHAAYQLACFLRRRVRKLIACVPRYARSAATLVCLCADQIVLDDLAALGPLDTQVYEGLTDGGRPDYRSALNEFKSLERLRDFSMETLRAAAEVLYDRNVGHTDDILRHALSFVSTVSGPLLAKIEAHKLGDYSQTLAIGENYGGRLLRRFHPIAKDRIADTITQLVHGYPSHQYVIDCQELRALGLQADVFTGREQAVSRALSRHDSTRLITLVDPHRPLSEQDWSAKTGSHGATAPGVPPTDPAAGGPSVPVPPNPWRLTPPGGRRDSPAARERAWAPPGPPIYDPPPWDEPEATTTTPERDAPLPDAERSE